jgi:hypothetical protein
MPESTSNRRARRPIDKEIEALAEAGLLWDTLISRENGCDDLGKAYEIADDAVDQALKWGTWYERYWQHQREVELEQKELAKESLRIGRELSSFAERLSSFAELQRRSPITPPIARPSVDSAIQAAAAELAARLEELSLAYPVKVNKEDGHPSDRRLLGFVWGMAAAWRQLTPANLGTTGRFVRFLQAGFETVRPGEKAPEWQTKVKTAIKRFGMGERGWLQPVVRGRIGKNSLQHT